MKKKKMLFRFLLPNLIVLLIAFCIASCCILFASRSVRRDTLQLTETISQQIEAQIETDLQSAQQMSLSLFQDMRLRYISVLPDPLQESHFDLRNLAWQIQTFKPGSDLFFSYYVLLNKSDLVFYSFSYAFSYSNARDFYGFLYSEPDATLDQWQEELAGCTEMKTFLPMRRVEMLRGCGLVSANCIPYVLNSDYNKITAVHLINADVLARMAAENLPHNTGTYRIQAPDGSILYDYDPDYNIGSRSNAVFTDTSAVTGWTYSLYIPNHVLYHDLYVVLSILALAFLVFFVGSLSITFYRAHRLSRPLLQAEKLLFSGKAVQKIGKSPHPMDALMDIINDQERVMDISIQQNSMLRSSFLKQLTLGEISSDAEIQRYLELLNIHNTFHSYQIIAGTLSYIEESDEKVEATRSIRSVLFEWLQNYFKGTVTMINLIDPERFVLLMLYQQEEPGSHAYIEKKMCGLSDAIAADLPYTIYFSLSNIYDSLLLTPKAYTQALETLAVFPSVIQDQIWSWSLSSELQSNSLFYSPALENNIIAQIRQSNHEEAENILQNILDENLTHRNISLCAYYQLVFSLKSFVYRLLQEFEPASAANLQEELNISACLSTRDLNRVLVVLRRTISYYCDLYKKKQSTFYSKPIQDALQIIERDFSSPDMSVSYVAQQLHLSDNYFSQLFKKENGDTFSSYLENIRLEYAITLLQEDYLISDISKMCGYINPKSFQRAFKRRFGTTASDYRSSFLHTSE